MRPTMPSTSALSDVQMQALRLTRTLWDAHARAAEDVAAHAGGMIWRRGRHGDHLVRAAPASRRDGRRQETELGPRSPETVALRVAFESGKAKAAADLARTAEAIRVQAGTNCDLGLGRFPRDAGTILRGLSRDGVLGVGAVVIGPAALLGYEAASGHRLTGTQDPVSDLATTLTLLAMGEGSEALESARRADPSLRQARMGGALTNRNGYALQVVPASEHPYWRASTDARGFIGMAVDIGGMPVPLVAPTPRAFVAERFRAAEEGRGDESSLSATIQARAAVACLGGMPSEDSAH